MPLKLKVYVVSEPDAEGNVRETGLFTTFREAKSAVRAALKNAKDGSPFGAIVVGPVERSVVLAGELPLDEG